MIGKRKETRRESKLWPAGIGGRNWYFLSALVGGEVRMGRRRGATLDWWMRDPKEPAIGGCLSPQR